MSKKKKKNKIHQVLTNKITIPRQYFKSIGADVYTANRTDRVDALIKKNIGPKAVDEFWRKHNESSEALFKYCFSNLSLSKLWYGNNMLETCEVAKALTKINVPSYARILDVGGGPGAMAFWMTHLWEDCEVTVADLFSAVGSRWAQEIKANRVKFIDDQLPFLSKIAVGYYDFTIMSRVLNFIVDMKPLYQSPIYSMDRYLATAQGQQLLHDMGQVADTINRILKPDGRAIIIDHWNDRSVYLTSMIFEQKGLYINLDLFEPQDLNNTYSALILSKTKDQHAIMDRPLGLSTSMNINNSPVTFFGASAESIRKSFANAKPCTRSDHSDRDAKVHVLNEILEKDGLALWYRAHSGGKRVAWIFPGIMIPKLISKFSEMESDLLADEKEILSTKNRVAA